MRSQIHGPATFYARMKTPLRMASKTHRFMNLTTTTGNPQARLTRLFCLTTLLTTVHGASVQGWQLSDKLTLKADLTLKETYDDNVFILDTAPYPWLTPPAGYTISAPRLESLVTSITPSLVLTYKPDAAFAATLSYAPEFTWYESAHSEDYVAHRAAMNFSGKFDEVTYDWLNSAVWIDGSNFGFVTMRPGDCRAIGGIPLRDRRDAAIYRDSLKVTIPVGKWFFRPVLTSYVHDFQTAQQANLAVNKNSYIYDNYVDRWEMNAGLDIGYEVFDKTKLVAGYRYGHQDQGKILKEGAVAGSVVNASSAYINDYQRFLLGVEGAPAPWVKLAVLAGPDVRDWQRVTPAGFARGEVTWYVDALVTLLPTKDDTITFKMMRFEQPASTSQSIYEDIRYDLVWRHKFSDKFTAGAGLTLYIGDWQAPVVREDWIYTPSLMASYAFNSNFSAEASWSYDNAVNKVTPVAGTSTEYAAGRQFKRNLVSIALKYAF